MYDLKCFFFIEINLEEKYFVIVFTPGKRTVRNKIVQFYIVFVYNYINI